MNAERLRLVRSMLFVPATNRRAIEKARGLDADMIVLDLEDSVKPADKEGARTAALAAAEVGFGDRMLAVRVNARSTAWYGEDLLALRSARIDCLVVPKVEHHDGIRDVQQLAGKPVLAMIETARGVLAAPAIADGPVALLAGTNDLAADLGVSTSAGRGGLTMALQSILLAARAARIPAFDGVFNRLEDAAGLEAECREGRSWGFDGKSLIHPGQVDTVNRLFGPAQAEIEEAERLVAAASGGAERFEGRMIEDLHVAQARALLARALR